MQRPDQLEYEAALPRAVPHQDLPGYQKLGAWRSVRILMYATAISAALIITWLVAGMR